MKKTAFLALIIATSLFACQDSKPSNSKEATAIASIENEASPVDNILQKYRAEDSIKKENERISHSKEIPVGTENFNKIVSFIEKHGFAVDMGPNRVMSGHQFTFYDSKGNRHGLIAGRFDANGNATKLGFVGRIIVYGYRDGIKNQEHFFPYCITPEKVYCNILELDGTWPDADRVKFGYEEFLKKVLKEK